MHGWLALFIHLPALVVYFGSTALGRFLVLRSVGLTVRQSLRVDGPTWQRLTRARRIGTWALPHLLALHAGFVLLVACGLATAVTANDGTVDPMPGRPAAIAGVLPGDRVVSVNGDPVRVFTDIAQRVKASSTDDIELDRGGTSLRLRVRRIDGLLGLRPSPREATLTNALEFATTFPVATVRSWASPITGDPAAHRSRAPGRDPRRETSLPPQKPWSDGTVALVHEPLDLCARIAALIPPPRFHMIRYHGVLSSHAK